MNTHTAHTARLAAAHAARLADAAIAFAETTAPNTPERREAVAIALEAIEAQSVALYAAEAVRLRQSLTVTVQVTVRPRKRSFWVW